MACNSGNHVEVLLWQVYYLQAWVCHSLTTNAKNKKEYGSAARTFALLTLWKHNQTTESTMVTSCCGGNYVLITKVKRWSSTRVQEAVKKGNTDSVISCRV